MYSVKVDLRDNPYEIMIGRDILGSLGQHLQPLKIGTDAIIITNPVIHKYHGKTLARGLKSAGFTCKFMEVPSGEKSKSVQSALKIIRELVNYGAVRRPFIIAFGGGVVGDLAGFVAAIYKRGIPYLHVPTTLLAQIDSAIGGKVAVDLPVGKNLIGAFYQPRLVYSDITLLSTLSRRQIVNGLAETVKYGIIADKFLFHYIEMNIRQLLDLNPATMAEVIFSCSRIKARVVTNDERETKGIRTILNFGHTIGHAIEAADRFRHYQHGEAVALGMRVAADISRRMKMLNANEARNIGQVLTRLGLPEQISHVTFRNIMQYMQYDKKFLARKNRFVLATGIGSVKVLEGIDRKVIRSAIHAFLKKK